MIRGPSIHGIGVGVVEEPAVGRGDLSDVPAKLQNDWDIALSIHDAASAEGIADALVDPIPERDVNISLKGLEATDSYHGEDVFGSLNGLAPIGSCDYPGRQPGRLDIAPTQLVHHIEIALVDVGERELDVSELGDAEDVAYDTPGESDAASSDYADSHADALPQFRLSHVQVHEDRLWMIHSPHCLFSTPFAGTDLLQEAQRRSQVRA